MDVSTTNIFRAILQTFCRNFEREKCAPGILQFFQVHRILSEVLLLGNILEIRSYNLN